MSPLSSRTPAKRSSASDPQLGVHLGTAKVLAPVVVWTW